MAAGHRARKRPAGRAGKGGLLGVACALVAGACGPSTPPIAEPPGLGPAPTAAPASAGGPSASALRERARLEEECLATPWVASEAKHGPRLVPPEYRERLDGLERGCRDVHPHLGPGRFATPSDIPEDECNFGIGRIYFELGHHPEAARWFHRVVVADGELGEYAGLMYLDTLMELARWSSPARPACRQLALVDAVSLVRRYCLRSDAAEACQTFTNALEGIEREE